MLKAVTRQAATVDAKIRAINENPDRSGPPISTANFFDHHATAEDVAVMVTEEDFLDAHRELVPSVRAGELQHYEHVRATFEGARDKQQQQQQQQSSPQQHDDALLIDVSPNATPTATTNNKGKGKAVDTSSAYSTATSSAPGSPKGKGKAVATTAGSAGAAASDEAEHGDGGEAYRPLYPHDNSSSANGRSPRTSSASSAKFQDGTASDDDGLY